MLKKPVLTFIIYIALFAGFALVFGSQKGYKFYLNQRKITNDKIYCMVEKIIDILQTNAADNSDNFLAVNHVRDMLIPPQDRKGYIYYSIVSNMIFNCFFM